MITCECGTNIKTDSALISHKKGGYHVAALERKTWMDKGYDILRLASSTMEVARKLGLGEIIRAKFNGGFEGKRGYFSYCFATKLTEEQIRKAVEENTKNNRVKLNEVHNLAKAKLGAYPSLVKLLKQTYANDVYNNATDVEETRTKNPEGENQLAVFLTFGTLDFHRVKIFVQDGKSWFELSSWGVTKDNIQERLNELLHVERREGPLANSSQWIRQGEFHFHPVEESNKDFMYVYGCKLARGSRHTITGLVNTDRYGTVEFTQGLVLVESPDHQTLNFGNQEGVWKVFTNPQGGD